MLKGFLLLFILLFNVSLNAQKYTVIKNYNVSEGLPSSNIYKTIQDEKGFLWITTDNGLAFFDGKKFKAFSKKQGLTDNDVPFILKDRDNKIWAFPFKKEPVFLNSVVEKFTTLPNAILSNTESYFGRQPFKLQNGGFAIYNAQGQLFIYKKQNLENTGIKNIRGARLVEALEEKELLVVESMQICLYKNNNIDTLLKEKQDVAFFNNNTLYTSTLNNLKAYKISNNKLILLNNLKLAQNIRALNFLDSSTISIITENGKAFIADLNLKIKEEIVCNGYYINQLFKDKQQNIWVATKANGLFKMSKNIVQQYNESFYGQNAYSTLCKQAGFFAAGNNFGTLFYQTTNTKGLYNFLKNDLIDNNTNSLQIVDNLLYISNNLSGHIAKITNNGLTDFKKINTNSKYLKLINDSILLSGSGNNLFVINIKNNNYRVDSMLLRVTRIAQNKNDVYIGSTSGLYKWMANKPEKIIFDDANKDARVTAINIGNDNLVWVGLASDTLFVLKDNRLIYKIPFGKTIKGNTCNALYSNTNGAVWVGTNLGLSKINYTYSNNVFSYNVNTVYKSDGLTGEAINDIVGFNDTIFLATNKGINYLPENFIVDTSNYEVFITSILLNDSIIAYKNNLEFGYNENNIKIAFSAADLTNGENIIYEYKINGGVWQQIDDNYIALRKLAPGNYTLILRSTKRNGVASNIETVLNFKINNPFWKRPVFWSAITALLFILLTGAFWYRRNLTQEQKMEALQVEQKIQTLEMQALKAQINPHFIFNCLNSIRSLIYENDIPKADLYLNKFSTLLRASLENTGNAFFTLQQEIDYIENYIMLEKLRMEEKLEYKITIDENVSLKQINFPAMLLQPFVENAIKHGIKYLRKKVGYIYIDITKLNNRVTITITDNGIGIEKSMELKKLGHSSAGTNQGMIICKRRAAANNIELTITALEKEKVENCGTKVCLVFKI